MSDTQYVGDRHRGTFETTLKILTEITHIEFSYSQSGTWVTIHIGIVKDIKARGFYEVMLKLYAHLKKEN